MTDPKYPNIQVTLAGEDGNAFIIMGKVSRALKHGGVGREELSRFRKQATSGDYDHLVQTCIAWVDVS